MPLPAVGIYKKKKVKQFPSLDKQASLAGLGLAFSLSPALSCCGAFGALDRPISRKHAEKHAVACAIILHFVFLAAPWHLLLENAEHICSDILTSVFVNWSSP